MARKKMKGFLLAFGLLILAGLACSDLSRMPVVTRAPDAQHTEGVEVVIHGMTETQSAKLTQEISFTPTLAATATSELVLPTTAASPYPTETPTTSPSSTPVPQPSSTNTAIVAPLPTMAGSIYFEDDFSSLGGWATREEQNRYSYGYVDGKYQISILVKNLEIWSIRDQQVKDLVIETELLDPTGSSDGYFGVICRWENADNYYRLTIGLDGTATIAKNINGGVQELLSIKPSQTDVLLKSPIKMRAVCAGSTLALYIQGTKLLEVTDDDHGSGSFGVVAGTKAAAGIAIYFDNYIVSKP